MRKSGYYSARTGKNRSGVALDLLQLKKLYLAVLNDFSNRGYFQEAYGYNCVDAGPGGRHHGSLCAAIPEKMLLLLKKDNLYPTHERIDAYSEDDLFDMIEFEFDHVSKPLSGRNHTYYNCGWHYATFDRLAGQVEFRIAVSPLIEAYADGFRLWMMEKSIRCRPMACSHSSTRCCL